VQEAQTRLKCNKSSASGYGHANLGIVGHMKQIVQQEGVSGLWKGNTTRMVKVAPACAIMISVYEFGKRAFGEVI
jgi:solute carrier family 25 protein 39/40